MRTTTIWAARGLTFLGLATATASTGCSSASTTPADSGPTEPSSSTTTDGGGSAPRAGPGPYDAAFGFPVTSSRDGSSTHDSASTDDSASSLDSASSDGGSDTLASGDGAVSATSGDSGGAGNAEDGGSSPSGESMPTGNFVSSASGITWVPFFMEDWDTPVALGSWPSGANSSVPGTVYTGPHSAWNQPNEGGSDSAGHGVGPTMGNGLWLAAETISVGPVVSSSPYAPSGSSVTVPASVMDVFQYVPSGGQYADHPLGCCISPATSYMNRDNATPYMAVAYRSRVIGWGEATSAGFKMVPLWWPVSNGGSGELDFIESDYLGNQGSFVSFALHSQTTGNSIVNYFSDQSGLFANVIPTGAAPDTASVFDLQDWHTFLLEWYPGAVTWWCDGHLLGTQKTDYSTDEWGQTTGAMTIPSNPMFWTWQIETSTLGTQPTTSNWAHVQNDWQVVYRMQ